MKSVPESLKGELQQISNKLQRKKSELDAATDPYKV